MPRGRVALGRVSRVASHAVLAAIVLAWDGGGRLVGAASAGGSWTAAASIERGYTDNLQEQPVAREAAWFTGLSAGLSWERRKGGWMPRTLAATARGRIYEEFRDFDYLELGPEAVFRIGSNDFVARYRFTPRRVLFEEDDGGAGVFYTEHAMATGVRRKFGAERRLRAQAFVEAAWAGFRDEFSDRDSVTPELSADLRYRVHDWFTPRLGFEVAARDARRDNYDRDAVALVAGFDSVFRHLTVGLRFKRSWRDYTVGSSRDAQLRQNHNFARNDEIQQLDTWVVLPLPRLRTVAVRGRYKFRDGASTRADRNFDAHEVGLELGVGSE